MFLVYIGKQDCESLPLTDAGSEFQTDRAAAHRKELRLFLAWLTPIQQEQ